MRYGAWWLLASLLAVSLSGCLTAPEVSVVKDVGAVRPTGAGPRFLQQVEWPAHLTDGTYTIGAGEDEQPGDMKDDGLLIMERRHTDRSYLENPWSEAIRIEGLHGTPANPVCLCDVELVYENSSGFVHPGGIVLKDSSWILIDNMTLYGAGILIENTHNVTITRSTFVQSTTTALGGDDLHVIDNRWIGHPGPLAVYENPPALGSCWPDYEMSSQCKAGSFSVFAGKNVRVEWNYFDGGGSVGGAGGTGDLFIHHNTFYHGGA